MICKNCGNEIPDSSRFCTFCGQKQNPVPAPETAESNNHPVIEYSDPVTAGPAAPAVGSRIPKSVPIAAASPAKPEMPAYSPQPEAPAYNPKHEAPAYNPQPEAPAYNPKHEAPAYNPQPEAPAYNPQPEAPAYNPQPGPRYNNPKSPPPFVPHGGRRPAPAPRSASGVKRNEKGIPDIAASPGSSKNTKLAKIFLVIALVLLAGLVVFLCIKLFAKPERERVNSHEGMGDVSESISDMVPGSEAGTGDNSSGTSDIRPEAPSAGGGFVHNGPSGQGSQASGSAYHVDGIEYFCIPDYDCVCPLELTILDDRDYYVYLEYIGESSDSVDERTSSVSNPVYEDMAFLIEGGSTQEIYMPIGCYNIYYVCGDNWQDEKSFFGSSSEFWGVDDYLEFYSDEEYYQGFTLEFGPEIVEQFSAYYEISRGDFPKGFG